MRGMRRMTAVESDRRKIEETYLKAVDIGYSYRLAKKMEEFKSNPVLGYRTAGSKAEFDTGEFLKAEMERIGLSDIHKDEICLDSWEFEKAVMRFTDRDGEKHEIQLEDINDVFVLKKKIYVMNKRKSIIEYNTDGENKGLIVPPQGYMYFRFCNSSKLEVICEGDSLRADSFGRVDYKFEYNLFCNNWERKNVVY